MAYPTVIASPAGAGPFVVRADGGLSPRGRALAWVVALTLLLVGAGALYGAAAAPLTGVAVPTTSAGSGTTANAAGTAPATSVASAAPTQAALGGVLPGDGDGLTASGVVPAEWDGPIVHLDWSGTSYSTTGATFVADRVISPGDLVHRTLTLANDGPAAAVMTVSIRVNQDLPEVARNPELAKDVVLFWDAAGVQGSESFAGLLAHESAEPGAPVPVAQVQVDQGATVRVTAGFRFAADVADHRTFGTDSTLLAFDVLAQLHGDTAVQQPELPRVLPRTGAAVLGWAAVAVGFLVAGWLLVAAARRRRRCDDCERRLDRDDRWNEYHLGHGRVHTRCVPCWEELGDLDRVAVG